MRARVPRTRVTHDRWLVSYADFITLLFGFFVVLYAFSKENQKKQAAVSQAIDTAFRSMGVFPGAARGPSGASTAGAQEPGIPMNNAAGQDVMAPAEVKDDLERIRRELAQTLSSQVATHTV